ncbi:glycosyltransferase family 4 protein, partial [candidate division FCPU426 bacterium]|nr:glycosyltransferase family 4 protein [candidate division FCPU426 bacterium]
MLIALIARGCRAGAGIELYTHELANRLCNRHEVTVLTHPREAVGCQAAIVPVLVPRKPLWYSIWAFSTKAGLVARRQAYDIVHTQGSDGSWGDVVTAHSCHVAGMRASLKVNPTMANKIRKCLSPAHRAVVAQEKRAFASARLIIAVSKLVRRQLRAAYPAVRNIPIQVVYPGVDTQLYSPAKRAACRLESRKHFGFVSGETVFVMVANNPRLKGADRLIRGLAGIRQEQAHILIASSSKDFPDLRRLAKNCGVANRVHIVHNQESTLEVYAAGDIYAALPEYESFGLTFLEAMACGLPVILTRNAGVAELMTPGVEGFLLPALVDTPTVTQAMDYLQKDEETCQTMGHAARITAEKYTWDRMIRQ